MVDIETTQEEARQALIDQFWESFPPTWKRIRGHVQAIATEHFDVTVEQFHVLRHIRKGKRSVSDLAEVNQISRSAISQTVDHLVGKGLISRHPDPHDRRFIQLALTPQGDELLNAIFKQNRAWMAEKFAGLDTERMRAIAGALQALKQLFDEPA